MLKQPNIKLFSGSSDDEVVGLCGIWKNILASSETSYPPTEYQHIDTDIRFLNLFPDLQWSVGYELSVPVPVNKIHESTDQPPVARFWYSDVRNRPACWTDTHTNIFTQLSI